MNIQYEINNKDVKLEDCIDLKKTNELIEKINSSNVSDKEKEFLRMASYRHLAFDYKNIADYYAIASKEMQELMEDSALVIIDLDDALQKGFAKLYEELEEEQNNG